MKVGRRLIFILLVFTALSLGAQTAGKPFTAAELDRFISDWPRFAERAGAAGYGKAPKDDPGDYLASIQAADLTACLDSLGWEVERFSYIAGNVGAALRIVQAEETLPYFDQLLHDRRSAVQSNADLSASQKEELVTEIDELLTSFRGYRIKHEIPASELALVRARKDVLRMVFRFSN